MNNKRILPTIIPDPERGIAYQRVDEDELQAWWDINKALRPSPTVLKIREDNDFLIVLDNNRFLYFLNNTAKTAYLMLNGKKGMVAILEELKNIYLAAFDFMENALIRLFYDLERYNLIKFV